MARYLSIFACVHLVLALPSLTTGCSPRVEGKSKGGGAQGGLPALVYHRGAMPGVRHEAHPDAPIQDGEEKSGAATRGSMPALTCSQSPLEAKAAAALDVWLRSPQTADSAPLPSERTPHMDPVGVTRFALAMPTPHPSAGPDSRSMRTIGNVRIRYAPEARAEEVGMLERGVRIPVTGFAGRAGCRAGWMSLGPHAFVCASRLEPDPRPPSMEALPKVPDGRITPGDYAYVRPGGAPAYANRASVEKKAMTRRLPAGFFIRFARLARVDKVNYWVTTKGLYVPIDRIARHVPSRFHGFHLAQGVAAGQRGLAAKGSGKRKASERVDPEGGSKEALRLPLGIVRFAGPKKRGIPVYHTPGKRREVGRLHRYTAVNVLGTAVLPNARGRRTRYLRIGPCQWVEARGLRVAHQEPPPPGVTENERWIDVDLKRQVLVAYEGRTPVYVTLVSTGKKGHETRHGVFRIYWKVAEVDMSSEGGAEEEYLAEAVPWSMFFWRGLALHGAYWHDSFGRARSHGCVNLSPLDARFLFEWATPTLPEGWRHSWHGERFPGTLVQVRRSRGETPRILGLARSFAPPEAVRAREEAYKRRIQQETLEMLRGRQSDDDEDDEADEGTPSTEVKTETASAQDPAAPKGAMSKRPAASSPSPSRKGGSRASGLQPTLRPTAPPPPPPGQGR